MNDEEKNGTDNGAKNETRKKRVVLDENEQLVVIREKSGDGEAAVEPKAPSRPGCGKLLADGCLSGCFSCLFFYLLLLLTAVAGILVLVFFFMKIAGSIFTTVVPQG